MDTCQSLSQWQSIYMCEYDSNVEMLVYAQIKSINLEKFV